ncbi:MAG: hypothetical protein AAF927_28070 [Bacteroidota bacterium]
MKSTRILFLVLVVGLFASCKPSPAVELTQAFTGQKWELLNLTATYDYEIEERYVKRPDTIFRYVDQVGTISLSYYQLEGEGVWDVNSFYTREQETQAGPLPTETFNVSESYPGVLGIWEFLVKRGGQLNGLSQKYFEVRQDCNVPFDFTGNWSIRDSEDINDPDRYPIITFEIAHLADPKFAGDLLFYPTIFERPGFFPVIANASIKERYGIEVLQLSTAYRAEGFELRSTSFEDESYGNVEVEEKLRTVYIEAEFRKVEDDPC